MKNVYHSIALATFATAVVATFALPAAALVQVKYPPGASAAAIAVNEQVRAEIEGKPGVEWCWMIDTSKPNGPCLVKRGLHEGGGDGGSGTGGNGGK